MVLTKLVNKIFKNLPITNQERRKTPQILANLNLFIKMTTCHPTPRNLSAKNPPRPSSRSFHKEERATRQFRKPPATNDSSENLLTKSREAQITSRKTANPFILLLIRPQKGQSKSARTSCPQLGIGRNELIVAVDLNSSPASPPHHSSRPPLSPRNNPPASLPLPTQGLHPNP